jgi:hypothetical protein
MGFPLGRIDKESDLEDMARTENAKLGDGVKDGGGKGYWLVN